MGFWKNVEDRRVYLGLTRKDLAQQAGIKYAVIGAGLERDSIPAANTALRISKVLKNSSDYNRDDFFDGRMVYHRQYFENNTDIKNAYQFARKVLEYYSGK